MSNSRWMQERFGFPLHTGRNSPNGTSGTASRGVVPRPHEGPVGVCSAKEKEGDQGSTRQPAASAGDFDATFPSRAVAIFVFFFLFQFRVGRGPRKQNALCAVQKERGAQTRDESGYTAGTVQPRFAAGQWQQGRGWKEEATKKTNPAGRNSLSHVSSAATTLCLFLPACLCLPPHTTPPSLRSFLTTPTGRCDVSRCIPSTIVAAQLSSYTRKNTRIRAANQGGCTARVPTLRNDFAPTPTPFSYTPERQQALAASSVPL